MSCIVPISVIFDLNALVKVMRISTFYHDVVKVMTFYQGRIHVCSDGFIRLGYEKY